MQGSEAHVGPKYKNATYTQNVSIQVIKSLFKDCYYFDKKEREKREEAFVKKESSSMNGYIDARNAKVIAAVLRERGLIVEQRSNITHKSVGFMNCIACLRWKEVEKDEFNAQNKIDSWNRKPW